MYPYPNSYARIGQPIRGGTGGVRAPGGFWPEALPPEYTPGAGPLVPEPEGFFVEDAQNAALGRQARAGDRAVILITLSMQSLGGFSPTNPYGSQASTSPPGAPRIAFVEVLAAPSIIGPDHIDGYIVQEDNARLPVPGVGAFAIPVTAVRELTRGGVPVTPSGVTTSATLFAQWQGAIQGGKLPQVVIDSLYRKYSIAAAREGRFPVDASYRGPLPGYGGGAGFAGTTVGQAPKSGLGQPYGYPRIGQSPSIVYCVAGPDGCLVRREARPGAPAFEQRIPNGASVILIEQAGLWSRVRYPAEGPGHLEGYVHSRSLSPGFITRYGPNAPAETPPPAPTAPTRTALRCNRQSCLILHPDYPNSSQYAYLRRDATVSIDTARATQGPEGREVEVMVPESRLPTKLFYVQLDNGQHAWANPNDLAVMP